MKMRGWRHLGVVFSVIWFVGFGVWMWITATGNVSDLHQSRLWLCYRTSEIQREPVRFDDQQRLARIASEEKACEDKASALFFEQWDTLRSYSWVIVLIDVASIALFWLLAWIIISVGRWVAIGFRT
jgi:hypothetical protein